MFCLLAAILWKFPQAKAVLQCSNNRFCALFCSWGVAECPAEKSGEGILTGQNSNPLFTLWMSAKAFKSKQWFQSWWKVEEVAFMCLKISHLVMGSVPFPSCLWTALYFSGQLQNYSSFSLLMFFIKRQVTSCALLLTLLTTPFLQLCIYLAEIHQLFKFPSW